MAKKKGICKNVDGCDLAAEKTIQEADNSQFVCSECGKPLFPIEEKKKGGSAGKGKLIGIIIAAVVVLAGAGFGISKFVFNAPKIDKVKLDKQIITLVLGESSSESLKATVLDGNGKEVKDAKVIFETGDEAVATVTQNGEVTAVKKGNTSITVKIDGKENLSTACQVEVIEKNEDPIPPEEPDPTPPVDTRTSGKVSVGYGTYDGPLSNGKAHGIGGEIIVTSTYTIDLKKASGETVTVHRGDKIMNVKMENGRLRQGEIHFNDGTRKYISGL